MLLLFSVTYTYTNSCHLKKMFGVLQESKVQQEQQTKEGELKKKKEVRAYKPPIRFPQVLQKSKLDDQFAKFLNMFNKLEINIPFAEALAQMHHYAKFMKDILNKKRKLDKDGVVGLSANCSVKI